jgi:magnesium transporter
MNFRKQHSIEPTPMQLAPLVDVLFLLVIFFAVTFQYAKEEQVMDVSVPAADEGKEKESRNVGEIIINIKKDGEIIVNGQKFNTTELDLFLGKDFLVTFHTAPLRSVSSLIERTLKQAGVGPRGPDRIAHTLIDLLVDNYAPVVDELRAELEELEEHVLARRSGEKALVTELLHVRNDFTRLRTIVRPQRDVIDRLARGENKLIRAKLLPYFRDLRDNLARLEDTVAGYHERLLMAFDIYLNKAAFEANEGIKFLTALTAITIPVMVIGTWYGMNFEGMSELRRGYPAAVGLTLASTILMFIYLRKKRWF